MGRLLPLCLWRAGGACLLVLFYDWFMAAHNELGTWGEEWASAYLRERGYVILERDWRSGHRDLDIVALDGDEVVFVEVKTRSSHFLADPFHTISDKKKLNIRRSVAHFMRSHPQYHRARFDIIILVGSLGQRPEVQYYERVRLIP